LYYISKLRFKMKNVYVFQTQNIFAHFHDFYLFCQVELNFKFL